VSARAVLACLIRIIVGASAGIAFQTLPYIGLISLEVRVVFSFNCTRPFSILDIDSLLLTNSITVMRQRYVPADELQTAKDECALGNGGSRQEGVCQLVAHVPEFHAALN
jgi:hypothetical protein